jgi:peptidoglycan/LPS O-acetylase OafA/YrhL
MRDRRRARLVLGSLLVTFIVVRLAMWRSPDSDFDIGGYNIHHLFTGVLLAAAAGVPLVLRPGRSRGLDLACLAYGAGLALALDEVVYLIATDGSNASYLLPVSFWGGIVVVGLGMLWVLAVGWGGRDTGGDG